MIHCKNCGAGLSIVEERDGIHHNQAVCIDHLSKQLSIERRKRLALEGAFRHLRDEIDKINKTIKGEKDDERNSQN